MPIKKKRIAFILYDYPLFVSTMVINSIALLAKENDVEVIINERKIDDASCDGWLRKLITTPPSFILSSLTIRLISKFCQGLSLLIPARFSSFAWSLDHIRLVIFSQWLHRRFSSQNYDIIIPIECLSLIAVNMTGTERGDIIYYNMELLDWSKEHPLYKDKLTLKKLEFKAIHSTTHVMITSPDRARIFCEINHFPQERISTLPVVPLRQEARDRTRYFRDKFSIPDHYLVVLYSGNFMPWAMCLEIIKSMDTWPKDVVLIMHTWNKGALSSEYFTKMQKAAENRHVIFSSDFLCHNDLVPAISSADIGLLFYESLDANFTEILFSSNKMAEYIAAGIPVICSPFPSLRSFVNEQGIGKSVEITEIGDALSIIQPEIDKYRQNVDICRRKNFEFEPYFYKAFSEFLDNGFKD